MARHAGFAAAICLRGSMLQDLQRVAYHAGTLGRRLQGSASGIEADLFLDLPRLEFHAADDDQVRLLLRAWGGLTVTPDGGGPAETRQVVLAATLLVQPEIGLALPDGADGAPQLTLALRGLLPPLLALSVTPFAGGPFSPAAQAVLDGNTFRLGLQALVGQRLQAMAPNGLDAGFLGGIAAAEGLSITAAVRDGLLFACLDLFDAAQPDGANVTTTGDPAALFDFTEGGDIAIAINRIAVPLAFIGIRDGVAAEVADSGATLRSYGFGVEDGHFFLGGRAGNSEGSVDFSMHPTPQLTRPGYSREYDELWFDMRDLEVDAHLSWWAAALASLGVLITLGFGIVVVEGLLGGKARSVGAGFATKGERRRAARVQEFTLPGTTEPLVRLTLQRFDCFAEEVFLLSTLRPEIPAPRVSGPSFVPVEHAIGPAGVRFSMRLPFDLQEDDPRLTLRWTVLREDTGAEVLVADGPAAGRLALSIGGAEAPFLETERFRVSWRLYRSFGAAAEELLGGEQEFRIFDTVDRSHPYLRWTHEVWAPQVAVRPDGRRDALGLAIKGRQSKLHRTDLPGRCRMVSRFSLNRIREDGPGVTPSVALYADALPFPRAELVDRRKQVCDYCFFGGPDKSVPIVP